MAKAVSSKSDTQDLNRLLGIGNAWRYIHRRIHNQNPTNQITIRSFTVKCKMGLETEYDSRYFCVLRASQGARDIVKFRRVGSLENLGHVLSDMMRSEVDWRDDKYGSDGNIE